MNRHHTSAFGRAAHDERRDRRERRDAYDVDELRGVAREPPDYFRQPGYDDRSEWQARPQQFEEYRDPSSQHNLSRRGDSHRGHGPRGYSRSDERIKEDVSEELTDHDEIDARQIEVSVNDGEVMLSGAVASRSMKRLAEDIAHGVRGVRDVHNQIRIIRSPT